MASSVIGDPTLASGYVPKWRDHKPQCRIIFSLPATDIGRMMGTMPGNHPHPISVPWRPSPASWLVWRELVAMGLNRDASVSVRAAKNRPGNGAGHTSVKMSRVGKKHRHLMFLAVIFCVVVQSAVAGGDLHQSEVRLLKGRPTFFIDHQPYTAPLYSPPSLNPDADVQYYTREMTDIGTERFELTVDCGEEVYNLLKPVWLGQDRFDFLQMDQRAKDILAANPRAEFMVGIEISAPKWWRDENPNELLVLSDGKKMFANPMYPQATLPNRTYESIASGKWRNDMAYALKRVMEHIQNSEWGKHVFTYEVYGLGTGEWYYWTVNQEQLGDYNPQMKARFQAWLKRKYKSEAALRESWSDRSITFASAQIPSEAERKIQNRTFRDPRTQMNVIDWYLFYSAMVADTIDYFAGVVKAATGRTKAVGAYYDYLFEFRGNPEFGHNAGRQLLESTNIDFICGPPSYFERQLGSGMEGYRRPFLFGTLHDKLWYHDNDNTSYLFPKVMREVAKKKGLAFASQDFAAQLFPNSTAQESIWLYQRSAGFTIAEGIYEDYFDLYGYYDDPRLLLGMKQITAVLDRSKNYDRSSIAQILVVADETSLAYGTWQKDDAENPYSNRINHSLVAHQIGFIKSGAPYDTVLLDDLPLVNLGQYKFIVFLNAWNVNTDMRQFIDRRIKSGGRTILWCYAPGLFNGNRESAQNMYELTGIHVLPSADETFIEPQIALDGNGKALMSQFGEKVLTEPATMSDTVVLGLKTIGEKIKQPSPELKKICKLFYVEDKDAQPLGTLPGTSLVTLAKKEMKGWTSLYTLLPALPPDLIRTIAKSAGVHIYTESGDSFYANKSYLVINAASAGTKTIRLPSPCSIYDALTERRWYANVTQFDVSLMVGETAIFRYVPTQ